LGVVKQILIQLSERDYHELLRCVRWVASDALNEANRRDAFSLAARIERAAKEVFPASDDERKSA